MISSVGVCVCVCVCVCVSVCVLVCMGGFNHFGLKQLLRILWLFLIYQRRAQKFVCCTEAIKVGFLNTFSTPSMLHCFLRCSLQFSNGLLLLDHREIEKKYVSVSLLL